MSVIKGLAEGREVIHHGQPLRIPWVRGGSLPMWMAAYGPKALRLVGEQADGFILQTADPDIARWTFGVGARRGHRRRAGPVVDHHVRGRARPTWGRTWRTSGSSCGGSAGWSATTSPTWSRGTGSTGRCRGR